ncbi:MAG: UDP-N-acetylmuramate dehydrogenase, partial [bacterium]
MSQNTGLRGQLLRDEPMSRHTSWRVGGPARCFYRPADSDDLAGFLNTEEARDPLLWLGLGSNLLVRDGGFSGTVIATKGRLDQIEVLAGNRISVGAGASCAKVARETARAGLCGAAFLAGIPGTMGGALAMNAGAFGGETWERVDKVNMVNRQGEILERAPEDFEISYRHVAGPRDEWFLSCEMQLEPGDIEQEQAAIRQLLDQRNRTQPTGMPSAGSTFRNPPGDYAARLI